MKAAVISLIVFLFGIIFPQANVSDLSLAPGAFSRMGFGARGMAMGNALSAVKEGSLVSYYNPALSVFQKANSFMASYSFLSLDRSLNFLSFTKRFELKSKRDTSSLKKRPIAGISFGIINSGVSKIEGRDNQGLQTGELKTSENQFFFSFANMLFSKLSLGLAVKIYYYKLYRKVSSTGVGFDLGAIYSLADNLNISAVISDINSRYKWDTSPLRGEQGRSTEHSFPISKKLGICYCIPSGIITAIEIESFSKNSNFLRLGAEYQVFDRLLLRGGIDRLSLSSTGLPSKPSAGFSFSRQTDSMILGVDYAFVIEPYSPVDQHVVGINILF